MPALRDLLSLGFVVVAFSPSALHAQAFQGLGHLPGGSSAVSQAFAVSGDGSVVVGRSLTGDLSDVEAFVWTEAEGLRALKAVLEDDHGLDLTGWTLQVATGVSADGTVVVDYGTNPDGNGEAWRVELPGAPVAAEPDVGFPGGYALHAASPNPASSSVTLRYEVPEAGSVRVVVYDALGREVAVLVGGSVPAGRHEAVFDAGGLPSGLYLVRMTAEGFRQTRTLTLTLLR